MFVAHLPAGWLLTRAVAGPRPPRALLAAGLFGAVAPDLDLVWFFATGGHTHHHAYPTHFPALWAAGLAVSGLARQRHLAVFALNGLVHQVLDSLVGDIAWLAPLDLRRWSWVTVPDRFDPWWLNFVLHWTFGVELAITAAAIRSACRPGPAPPPPDPTPGAPARRARPPGTGSGWWRRRTARPTGPPTGGPTG